MKRITIALSALAGAALFEAALIPGVLIGGAALLAPRLLPKSFGSSRRRRTHSLNVAARWPTNTAAVVAVLPGRKPPAAVFAKFPVKRTIFKTITFRIVATTLDFSSNYVITGDIAASAALSAYGFVAGPTFFFLHEMLWHRFGSRNQGSDVRIPMPLPSVGKAPLDSGGGFTIRRPLAKTITFRSIVTTTDFAANFVVTGSLADATVLTAFGFVVGPFVYYYHEKLWDRLNPPFASSTTSL